jgi:hypothetical protein
VKSRYRGVFRIETRHRSLDTGQWSQWGECGKHGTYRAAEQAARKMCSEKTKVP